MSKVPTTNLIPPSPGGEIPRTPSPAIPTHLRPTSTRHNSSSSIASNSSRKSHRPYPQHREYIPGNNVIGGDGGVEDGIAERLLFEQAEAEFTHEEEEGEEGEEEEEVVHPEWDNLRDGSIPRRPAWRRPRPLWCYPFIIGAAVTMGMGMAPRSELFINLACLAHPPAQPSSLMFLFGHDNVTINTTLPTSPDNTPWSPADEWFKHLQREIYDYKLHHQASTKRPPSNTTTTVILPQPTTPAEPTRPNEPVTPQPLPSDGPTPPRDGTIYPPYHEIDPRLCKRDPGVQAAAARLTMIMTLMTGTLSALTTGYWGQTSDRIGRTKIMALVEFGLLLNEGFFILVATFPYLAPGGYRSLLAGPFVEGCLGGFATITATVHAYMADVTTDGSRVTVFSRLAGIMMVGFASGPVLGSMLIKATNNIMAPFYINMCIHILYIPLFLFLLPESLSSEARMILDKNAKLAHQAANDRDAAEREWENETPAVELANPLEQRTATSSKRTKRLRGSLRRTFRRATGFLQPLAIFLPREMEDGRKDWSLTFVGCSISCMSMLYGIMTTKTQFTLYTYGWTSAQLGPYMSFMGFSRAFVLLVLLPVVMHYVKPHFTHAPPESPSSSGFSETETVTPPSIHHTRSSALDLYTTRTSNIFVLIPYACIAFFNPTATQFVFLSWIMTLGSADGAVTNSLALSLLPSSSEAGRLFGAISVIHALGSTLISPLLFGTLFAYTVGTYAPAVFALAAGFLVLQQVFLACVRLPGESVSGGKAERGRSRAVKRVKSSAGARD